jgi:hypothetical protein
MFTMNYSPHLFPKDENAGWSVAKEDLHLEFVNKEGPIVTRAHHGFHRSESIHVIPLFIRHATTLTAASSRIYKF